jgi:chloramphenicol 3-O phosphotransferase
MAIRVIVLNGTSSSGKSSIARCLQCLLPEPWLTIGVDDLISAVPPAMLKSEDGLTFTSDGEVIVGPGYRTLEAAWSQGVAAMARAGSGLILDVVLLQGGVAQRRWSAVLEGLQVLWVGVRCDPLVAAVRESNRGDRIRGMAAKQARLVHQGMVYDMEVDTTHTSPEDSAQCIVSRIISNSF